MIGVFDSGFGGLSILKDIRIKLPNYSYIYLGDNKNAPYGEKTQEEIFELTKKGVDFLFNKGCKIVIIACNTASTRSLRRLQQQYKFKKNDKKNVLGIIIPVLEVLADKTKETKNGRIGILATPATVKTKVFEKELNKLTNRVNTFIEQPASLLVPLIESGKKESLELDIALDQYLSRFKNNTDYLIIGCTHYSFIVDKIKEKIEPKTKIIDSANIIGNKLKQYLEKHLEIKNELNNKKSCIYYTTGDVYKFKKFLNDINPGERYNIKKKEN